MMAIQRRATLRVAAKCPSLRMIVWNASGWDAESDKLATVWVWRTFNGEDRHPRNNEAEVEAERGRTETRVPSAVCEGKRGRYGSSISRLFRDMRSFE
jgi:hypothetical protein